MLWQNVGILVEYSILRAINHFCPLRLETSHKINHVFEDFYYYQCLHGCGQQLQTLIALFQALLLQLGVITLIENGNFAIVPCD